MIIILKIPKILRGAIHFVAYIQTNALWGKLLTKIHFAQMKKNNGKSKT
jgi:hypothetical protein